MRRTLQRFYVVARLVSVPFGIIAKFGQIRNEKRGASWELQIYLLT